ADLVYTDRINFEGAGDLVGLQSDLVKLWEGQVFGQLLSGNFITLSSVLVRRETFVRCGGFDSSPDLIGAEDWDLWLRMSGQGAVIALCREPLTLYRRHGAGISRNLPQMHTAIMEVLRRAFVLGGATLTGPQRRHAMARAFAVLGWIADGVGVSSLKYWFRVVFFEPASLGNWKQLLKSCMRRR
ncbi:MAG: hypothetical protein KDA51_16015, partial [Planctomycetales bacterium]|nr:hypothetical protein [Planctomycetales bacterium]